MIIISGKENMSQKLMQQTPLGSFFFLFALLNMYAYWKKKKRQFAEYSRKGLLTKQNVSRRPQAQEHACRQPSHTMMAL